MVLRVWHGGPRVGHGGPRVWHNGPTCMAWWSYMYGITVLRV